QRTVQIHRAHRRGEGAAHRWLCQSMTACPSADRGTSPPLYVCGCVSEGVCVSVGVCVCVCGGGWVCVCVCVCVCVVFVVWVGGCVCVGVVCVWVVGVGVGGG